MAVPISELQGIAPSAIIELFELQLNTAIQGSNTIYRFHAGVNATGTNGNVVWAGNSYQAFPIEADGFEYSGNGQLPRPKIRVSNILGTITAIILATPLEGAKVTRIRTMARYLDAVNFPGGVNPLGTPDPTATFPPEIFYIDRKSAETRDAVEFELAAAFDLVGIRAPKRQCISNICQWAYRSAECGYTGTAYFDENDVATTAGNDVCGKRLSSCKKRFGYAANFSTSGTTDTLNFTNSSLAAGNALVSTNGWYKLLVQSDGNVVVYSKANIPIWATSTGGSGNVYLKAQNDGNLVVYRVSDNTAIWSADTTGKSSSRLVMQNDGNLVIYTSSNTPVWSIGYYTNVEPVGGVQLPFGSFPGVGTYFT